MATVEILTDLPSEDYHADPAISSTMAKVFRQSRREFEAIYVLGTKEQRQATDRMQFGTVSHAAILEPHIIEDLIVEIPESALTSNGQRRGKAWDEFSEANAGKILFGSGDIRKVRAMQQACYRHPLAGNLLRSEGPTEHSLFVTCQRSGLRRSCRIDKHAKRFIIDVKTTEDVSPAGFARTIANLDYEFSAAWYVDVCEQATGERKEYLWIAVSTTPPHPVRVYKLLPESEIQAWQSMDCTLTELANCYDTDNFADPGENDVIELGLPAWKTRPQWEFN